MNQETLETRIDFLQLYVDLKNEGFVNSLGLEEEQTKVVSLLFEQCDSKNPLYVPDLALEGLVHDQNTPYQALRALHHMKARRIILYELCEEVYDPTIESIEEVIYAPIVAAAEQKGVSLPEAVKNYETTVRIIDTVYRRAALFNLEYPVVYFCLEEEKSLDPKLSDDILPTLYQAIVNDSLADVLKKAFPVILEFLNYVQSLFEQPLTGKNYETTTPEKTDNPVSSSRRLARRADTGGNRHPARQTQIDHLSVEKETGVDRGGWGEGSQETSGADKVGQQAPDENHHNHSSPVGIGK